MSRLAISLLGSPRIERDNILIDVDTRKAIALIAYLAVSRQRQSRDALANLLWPEYDQPHARATLRRTLSTLNKALEGPWLNVDRETIGLEASPDLWIDVVVFYKRLEECRTHGHPAAETCLDCLMPLTEAVALYRDDFLVGFSLRDSPNFDDWQFYQADSLRREFASTLERLVHCHSVLGDFEAAITYARRWLALDRLHEPAHRVLMQLYAWSDQRAAALHQYRECVQVLEQELGVAPLESTTRLYQAIKENQAPQPPVQQQAAIAVLEKGAEHGSSLVEDILVDSALAGVLQSPASNAAYPLVGRTAEFSTLLQAYDSIGNSGRVIILEGEAGIGKTRLAEEYLSQVQTRGATVIAARCYEGETELAYGPVVAGLRSAIAHKNDTRWLEGIPATWLSEAARLLPELVSMRPGLPPAPPLDSPGVQSQFFEGLRQVLLAVCRDGGNGEHPGVLFFDDVHWADGASLELLTYMVRRLREQPLCLMFTWRNRQLSGDSRLNHLLAEAQRFGLATILALSRLSGSTIKELVQSITGESKESAGLSERLYQETEGIPFFLTEYLAAIARGVLAPENKEWALPGGVRDLLHSRLAAVSEIGSQLLTTAAVVGRSFDFDTLREASGRSEEETVIALEELIAQGLVEEVRGGSNERALTYDFCYENLRALVYEETSLARRRLLHRRIAEALAGRARGHSEIGVLPDTIARHYQMAGNDAAAANYFKIAGERARALYANKEALAHFRMALALGYPDSAGLHEAIGDLHTLLGEYNAALKSYETAAALCNPAALANVEHKLGIVYQRRGEWELAESHLEAALHALEDAESAGERAKIYIDWSLIAHHRDEISQALELAQEALKLAETAQDMRALAQAHNLLGILANSQGNVEGARHLLERSLALAERLNDPVIRVAALNNLALAYRNSGAIDQALALSETALALCASLGDRHREAALHSNMADLLHAAGRTQDAMSHLTKSVSILSEIGEEAGTLQPEIWKLTEW